MIPQSVIGARRREAIALLRDVTATLQREHLAETFLKQWGV
jgi:hypothetical protein